MADSAQKPDQVIDVDQLAREKIEEVEKLLGSKNDFNIDNLNSWFSILKQIITAADLHRTNDKNENSKKVEIRHETDDNIYADYVDDNEQFNAVDLTERLATNPVKWTIRVQAFKIVHRLVQMFCGNNGKISNVAKSPIFKHLPDLVRLSFVAATSPYDDLKLQGFEMFNFIVKRFAFVEEIEFPGHSILEQYKTQFLSAIKPAFDVDAPPYITAVASQVCSLWICQGLEKDPNDMKRAYQLMLVTIEKLENQSINQNSKLYTESELEQERLDILSSWALLYIASNEPHFKVLNKASCLTEEECNNLSQLVGAQIKHLIHKWWEALKDYALLIMPSTKLIGKLHENEHVYTREVALRLFEPVWPKLTLATSIWLCKDDTFKLDKNLYQCGCTEKDGDQIVCDKCLEITNQNRATKVKYCKFIFGIIMRELCRSQVDEGKSPYEPLNENTIISIRSLQLLLTDEAMKSVLTNDPTLGHEFYTALHNIVIYYWRDQNRSILRSALDSVFDLILKKTGQKDENLHFGLTKLIFSIKDSLKSIKDAIETKNRSDLDVHKICLSIRLQNLISIIKFKPEQAIGDALLRQAIIEVFQEMLCFNSDYTISLNLIGQLKDLNLIIPQEYSSQFMEKLFQVQIDRVRDILNLISKDKNHEKVHSYILKFLPDEMRRQFERTNVPKETKPQVTATKQLARKPAKIALKADFSNFYAKK